MPRLVTTSTNTCIVPELNRKGPLVKQETSATVRVVDDIQDEFTALFQRLIQWPTQFRAERECHYTPQRTFWLFLGQVMSAGGSCHEAVAGFRARLGVRGKDLSTSSAAYCKARKRLPEEALEQIRTEVAGKTRALAGSEVLLWRGRRVKAVDGSSVSMPDTPENQAQWPQPSVQKPGCGFPVMRLAVLFCMASGVVVDCAKSALGTGERTLFRSLWHALEKGDIVLADRGFCCFADYWRLPQRGVDCLMRKNTKVCVTSTLCKQLGKGDKILWWHKSPNRPPQMDYELWNALPATILVREVVVDIAHKGFRTKHLVIATTLLNATQYPKSAVEELYRQRWKVELWLRDLKITQGADILRCKSPEMIHKELAMYMIAYNLVRACVVQAALEHGHRPEELAYKPCLDTLRQWAKHFTQPKIKKQRLHLLWELLLDTLARNRLPERPDRSEPRAKKRRPKNYAILNKPRKEFKEIPHRNQYKATLS